MQGCVCLPDTFHSGGSFLHLSTHLSVRAGADSRLFHWLHYGADPEACDQCAEKISRRVSVCVCARMCFCVLKMGALYHRQSIRHSTNISMTNCISSLEFSSLFTKPMWELTNSSHMKFGQWSWGLLVSNPHWKCHYKLKTDDTTRNAMCLSFSLLPSHRNYNPWPRLLLGVARGSARPGPMGERGASLPWEQGMK